MTRLKLLFNGAGILAAICLSQSAFASALYLTEGQGGIANTYIVNNGVLSSSYQWTSSGQIPIYVEGDKVRQAGYDSALNGAEYNLDGTPTGITYGPVAGQQHYDAGFDGTNVYMVDWTSGTVATYDKDFTNKQVLFAANGADIGITFDTLSNSIWTSNWSSAGLVSQWALDGTLLSSFSVGSGASALAWDPADDTLWMAASSGNRLVQYTKTGQLLNDYGTAVTPYVLGGEFGISSAIPEPTTLALMGLGLAGIGYRRKRKLAA